MYKLKLAAIVGPTAAGKSELAIELAVKMNAEIISCDSMQVYRGLDIGTAKTAIEQREGVVHHLIDVVDPDKTYSVAEYQKAGKELIAAISARGRLPLLVGGTGLYYQALVDDYDFIPLPNQQQVRHNLEETCSQHGLEFLYSKLQAVDPEYAARIGPNDRKRTIRALEIWEITGQAFSKTQIRRRDTYCLAVAGLFVPREILYENIEKRVDKMLAQGLVEEVAGLKARGLCSSHSSMQALGYKQVLAYLEGRFSYDEMQAEIKKETRRYAKRQYTWFKKDDRIRWFNLQLEEEHVQLVDKICYYMASVFNSR